MYVCAMPAGTLPASWAEGFPSLSQLWLYQVPVTGSLPPSWGSNGSFPILQDLQLNSTKLSGPLPAEWGSSASFQQLQLFYVHVSTITGKCIFSQACLARLLLVKPLDFGHLQCLQHWVKGSAALV